MADQTLTTLFTNIANAIRSKDGSSAKIAPKDFASKINNIPVSSAQIKTFSKKVDSSLTTFKDIAGTNRNLYGISLQRGTSAGQIPFVPDLIFCISSTELLYCSYWIRSDKTSGDVVSVFYRSGTASLFPVSWSGDFPSSFKMPTNINSGDISTKGTFNVIAVKF